MKLLNESIVNVKNLQLLDKNVIVSLKLRTPLADLLVQQKKSPSIADETDDDKWMILQKSGKKQQFLMIDWFSKTLVKIVRWKVIS